MLPEDGQTLDARNAIFHELIGHDGHGNCRTYRRIVPQRAVYKDGTGPSQSTPQPSTIDQITQQVPTVLDEQGAQLLAIAILMISRTWISDRIVSLNRTTVKYVLEQDKAAFTQLIGVSILQSAASSFVAPSLRCKPLNAQPRIGGNSARQPPSITCPHHEYDQALARAATTTTTANETTTINSSFFFGPKEIRAIRNHLPHHHHSTTASTFELLTACIWQCRTRALCLAPDKIVRISCVVNGRGNKHGLNLPPGYYGNVITFPTAMTKAGMLSMLPLGYALELVKKAKAQVKEEYLRSVADLMVIKGRPSYTLEANKDYIVSDTTRAGFDKVDFGLGKPVFGGVPRAISLISVFARFRDIRGGEDGIMVPICLPESVMDRFEQELKKTMLRRTE
ncbi:methanol O-anthraniloyltransferase-like [Camellia sinensis]|uniref:methanol O-anthraniloyltransferase-like n=1 Tax=Camellia sinensis TaxID=4442 RepID=UPI00103685AB|nr:methanol O-anthraniloyltransferase-like [Camellia sinensis]